MDENIKDIVLWCSGFEGFFNNENKFIGLQIGKERRKVITAVKDLSERIAKLHVNNNELSKLVKEIEAGEVTATVIRDFEKHQNKKRRGKECVIVNRGAIEDLAELTIWKMCEGCNVKKKRCKVRTTLLKLDMYPPCHLNEIEM